MKKAIVSTVMAVALFACGNVVFGQTKVATENAAKTPAPQEKAANEKATKSSSLQQKTGSNQQMTAKEKVKAERSDRRKEMKAKGMSDEAIRQHMGPAVNAEERSDEKTELYKTKLNLTPEQQTKVNAIVLNHENKLEAALEKAGTDGAARQAIVDKDHAEFINDMEKVLTPTQHGQLKSFHGQPVQGGFGNPNGGE